MKLNALLLFLGLSLLMICCGERNDEPPLVEKSARIEIDFGGSVDQYMITFGVHTLMRGANGFVTPIIKQPAGAEWSQIIPQANSYNLTVPITFQKLTVETQDPVHTLAFLFNSIHSGETPDANFQVLTASIIAVSYTHLTLPTNVNV